MPGSSSTYSATLRVDALSRALVTVTGAAFACTGLAILAMLPLPAPVAACAGLAWLVFSGGECLRMHRSFASCVTMTLTPDGHVAIEAPDGARCAARLAAGSLVLDRVAWVRLAAPEAPARGELLRKAAQDHEQWRRFQVICRHLPS